VKENDACQQHIVRASIREPPHTDDVVVNEETLQTLLHMTIILIVQLQQDALIL